MITLDYGPRECDSYEHVHNNSTTATACLSQVRHVLVTLWSFSALSQKAVQPPSPRLASAARGALRGGLAFEVVWTKAVSPTTPKIRHDPL